MLYSSLMSELEVLIYFVQLCFIHLSCKSLKYWYILYSYALLISHVRTLSTDLFYTAMIYSSLMLEPYVLIYFIQLCFIHLSCKSLKYWYILYSYALLISHVRTLSTDLLYTVMLYSSLM